MGEGRVKCGFIAHGMAGEEAGQLQVVVAQQKQAAAFVDQAEHDAQHPGVVRAIIGEVAELDDEAVGGGGIRESGCVAVHVTHHSNGCVPRKRSDSHDGG